MIIDKYIIKKKLYEILSSTLLIILSIFYLVFYINVFICQKDLEKSIKNQLKENKDTIEIVRFPSFANCNINPDNPFHLEKFKKYYHIPDNTEIKFIDNKWHYIIIYQK